MMTLEEYISDLDKNTGNILQLLKECSEAQLEKKEGSAWSILEILEHLLLTDQVVYRLLSAPPQKQGEAPDIIGREKLKRFMVDGRARKVAAPEFIKPTGSVKSEAEFIEKFLKQRGKLVQALESGAIVLDNDIVAHPMIGDMSKRDWLGFVVYHAERHLLQIKDRLAEF